MSIQMVFSGIYAIISGMYATILNSMRVYVDRVNTLHTKLFHRYSIILHSTLS